MRSHSTLAGEAKMFRKSIAYSISLTLLASFAAVAQTQDRLESQKLALNLISDTADRICNEVSRTGETRSAEVSGQIQAQLKGLAARLLNVGVSTAGNITSSQYQNVLQEHLARVLVENAACKLEVLKLLKGSLLETANTEGVRGAAGAQSPKSQGLKPFVAPASPSALNSPCVPTPRASVTAKVAGRDAGLNGPATVPPLQNPVSAQIPIDDDEWTFLWPGFMATARATGGISSQILVGIFTNDERGLLSAGFLGTCGEGQHFRVKSISARRIIGQIISVRAGHITLSFQDE
jgi:hypothetical protein